MTRSKRPKWSIGQRTTTSCSLRRNSWPANFSHRQTAQGAGPGARTEVAEQQAPLRWAEFNSSGYYREHLWSLLNLADFSLDKEIRDKAALVVDLMLFDVARFLHKGTMGAAGDRSQFKSKGSGWDNALCDVVEILFGPRGVFSDGDSQIGAALASSTYKPPKVLLEIGINPPDTPFTDRSRVSVSFEEAPKYGIGYSQDSDQRTRSCRAMLLSALSTTRSSTRSTRPSRAPTLATARPKTTPSSGGAPRHSTRIKPSATRSRRWLRSDSTSARCLAVLCPRLSSWSRVTKR